MTLEIARRIAPALPQFEESEHQEGRPCAPTGAADPSADRVKLLVRCPACGQEQESVTTLLRQEPTGRVFAVGDRWPLRPDRINGYWFFDVRAPVQGGPLVVLEGDCCPACGTDLWFELTFENEHLVSTRQVALSRGALERCHVCTTHASLVAAALVGGQVHQMASEDVIGVLKAHLLRPEQLS